MTLKRAFKTITQDNGEIKIFGNNHDIELYYNKPEWSEDEETCFDYKGTTYYLCEFPMIDNNSPLFVQTEHGTLFDAYSSDSFFSGILIKLTNDNESVRAYTYIS